MLQLSESQVLFCIAGNRANKRGVYSDNEHLDFVLHVHFRQSQTVGHLDQRPSWGGVDVGVVATVLSDIKLEGDIWNRRVAQADLFDIGDKLDWVREWCFDGIASTLDLDGLVEAIQELHVEGRDSGVVRDGRRSGLVEDGVLVRRDF